MSSIVKKLRVELIDRTSANAFVRRWHYSGKVVQNSSIHFGVFDCGVLSGVLSYGPPIDKNRAITIVPGTVWHGMLELNRMAFADRLPKNSESRCLAITLKMIKKQYPFVQWVQTFADACQCGDGTIYRAVGFLLIGIKKNQSLRVLESGKVVAKKTLDHHQRDGKYLSSLIKSTPLSGFQIKYVYFLDPTKRKDLTVPVLPYSAISMAGAAMYKGKCAISSTVEHPAIQSEDDGSIPIVALHEVSNGS